VRMGEGCSGRRDELFELRPRADSRISYYYKAGLMQAGNPAKSPQHIKPSPLVV
jgi:hypothetical protein